MDAKEHGEYQTQTPDSLPPGDEISPEVSGMDAISAPPGPASLRSSLGSAGFSDRCFYNSAPMTPTGRGSSRGSSRSPCTARVRRVAPTVAQVVSSGDFTLLANLAAQQQADREALQAAIDAKIDAAMQRRSSLIMAPRSSLSTPVSMILKSNPGLSSAPKGWRHTWGSTPDQVQSAFNQMDCAMEASIAHDKLQFKADLEKTEADYAARRKREADIAAQAQERGRLHQERAQRAYAEAQAKQQARLEELEGRVRDREQRSCSLQCTMAQQRQARLQQQQQSKLSRSKSAYKLHEEIDSCRAMWKEHIHTAHLVKRSISEKKRREVEEALNDKMRRERLREQENLQRAMQLADEEKQKFEQKHNQVDGAVRRAIQYKQKVMQSLAQRVKQHTGVRFAKAEQKQALYRQCRSAKELLVHRKHEQLSTQLTARSESLNAALLDLQRRDTAHLITYHNNKVLAEKLLNEKKLPGMTGLAKSLTQIPRDVQATVARISGCSIKARA